MTPYSDMDQHRRRMELTNLRRQIPERSLREISEALGRSQAYIGQKLRGDAEVTVMDLLALEALVRREQGRPE
ncbi:hypothetical protein GGP62_002191 [Salinibacter ruber]|jgi:hypothetical protein|uniref:hypothetical protein n=1 Tax=Salinibacter ruber TaxID=146919 RepID=UPI00216A9A19|nr:hypothetical protein [Salinibacter ruber]MCS3707204.1 hypothetical protein [Salinibacter ruber]